MPETMSLARRKLLLVDGAGLVLTQARNGEEIKPGPHKNA